MIGANKFQNITNPTIKSNQNENKTMQYCGLSQHFNSLHSFLEHRRAIQLCRDVILTKPQLTNHITLLNIDSRPRGYDRPFQVEESIKK